MSIATVLLVDDEVPFVETMTKRLSKRDLRISSAFSGMEALDELAKDNAIEVVILDVKMPGIDGIDTLREIKKRHPLVEVVMLTGHATVETAIEGMKLGAFDYLIKPVKLEDLLSKMAAAFENKNAHDQKIRAARIKELTRFPGRDLGQQSEDEGNK